MSGLLDALALTAAASLVISRQFRASRIDTDRRWWVLPVVLGVVALREPGVIDGHHQTAAVLLLAAEVIVGLVTGAGWAWTTRIWTEADGAVWSRGTRASVAVWGVGIALRAGLYGIGAALGVRQDGSALLLSLAVTLLVRSGVLARRLPSPGPAGAPGRAYRGAVSRPAGREPA
ncbi:membrane protein [Streptomyces sp. NRRL F-4707]|uniref:hypothetical protein n=1 Tax=Streptomyces sp. NRRL F-4707 TaxID=1519496 RepID=UPI0006AD97C4|nr:hypothetical protein [Streptomyces sp. NRRL F-4707]KOX34555.1 membrane protein [Streptomyces sp. NRRL F-4707]